MNPRTTGILLIVAAALGAFVWFYELGGEESRREAEEAAKRLFPGIEASDVSAIALRTRDGAEARIERRGAAGAEGAEDAPGGAEAAESGAGWQLVAPVDFPADAFALDAMASSLATLASESEIGSPQPLAEYGLDPDSARAVRFEADGAEHVLRIGHDTPVGGGVYVATGEREAVYTVPRYGVNGFDKSLDELRERRVLAFDREAVTRIEASWPEGGVVLERVAEPAGGEPGPEAEEAPPAWRIVSPIEARADATTVGDLLDDLSYLRALGFVDEPSAAELASFDAPAFSLTLALAAPGGEAGASGAPAPLHFAIGGSAGEDARLVRAEQPSLYTIDAERVADFPRSVDAYRYKELSSYAIADANSLQLFFQPAVGEPVTVTATRGDRGWTSEPERIDPAKLARIVSELSRLRAEGIVGDHLDEAALASLELSPPNAIVTVLGRAPAPAEGEAEASVAAPVLAEVQLGHVEGSEWVAARTPGDPTVYRLSYELAEHLPVSLEALHNRFVAPATPEPAADLPEPADALDVPSPGEESP